MGPPLLLWAICSRSCCGLITLSALLQKEVSNAGFLASAGNFQTCVCLGVSSVRWKRVSTPTGFPCLCGLGAAAPLCFSLRKVLQYRQPLHRTKGLHPGCSVPCRHMQESYLWTLFKDVDCSTGRIKSSSEYFTVFAEPCNAIFSAQCCTRLIPSPWFFLFILFWMLQ